jgi:hypothetical protein
VTIPLKRRDSSLWVFNFHEFIARTLDVVIRATIAELDRYARSFLFVILAFADILSHD